MCPFIFQSIFVPKIANVKKGFIAAVLFLASLPAMPQKMDSAQLAVKKVYIDFARWYKTHGSVLDGFDLISGVDTGDNGLQPPYRMNWKNVEKYFATIRKKVPWLGETFIANERKFLKSCEKAWKKHPEEEIIMGFDYDRFVGGQESPDFMVNYTILSKKILWRVDIKGDDATIYYMEKGARDDNNKPMKITDGTKVKMKKEKGVWKIALLQNETLGDW